MPSPITGIASPLDGIGRVIIVPGIVSAPAAITRMLPGNAAPNAPPIAARTSRRRIALSVFPMPPVGVTPV